MIAKLFATAVVAVIAALSLFRYRSLNSSYRKDRPSLPSDASFAVIYKILVIFSVLVALTSYWSNWAILVKVHDSDELRIVGSILSVLGIIGFEASVRALGEQYSPCFDLRIPTERVKAGPYRWLSHPMYLSNIGILTGSFISSGSFWTIAIASIVGIYYLRSARTENRVIADIS